MFKMPTLLLFFALLIANFPLAAAEKANNSAFTGVITGSKVRMRTQPTQDGHVVRETSAGELFVVTGEESGYYTVTPPKGSKGYVFRTFILDGTVEGERVNIRLYPDMEAPVIGQLNTGDRVNAIVSDVNNKWLEIDLPSTAHFYIAKEYIENKGPVELFAKMEKRQGQALHHLSAAYLFAQAEIQKPFEQLDVEKLQEKFAQIAKDYHDLPEIREKAQEALSTLQDVCVQKKISFLESKADKRAPPFSVSGELAERLAKLGIQISPPSKEIDTAEVAVATKETFGLATTVGGDQVTDRMLVWQPLEESMYHLWAATHGEKTMDEFYAQEEISATVLTGVVEPYTRPVKNRPGDYILKSNHLPVAFLYSTRVNLQSLVGQKVTVVAASRPNHNFAFPAYFVISIE